MKWEESSGNKRDRNRKGEMFYTFRISRVIKNGGNGENVLHRIKYGQPQVVKARKTSGNV